MTRILMYFLPVNINTRNGTKQFFMLCMICNYLHWLLIPSNKKEHPHFPQTHVIIQSVV